MKTIYWCPHITYRKDYETWFIYLYNTSEEIRYYLPIFDEYKYCPICGKNKPEEIEQY